MEFDGLEPRGIRVVIDIEPTGLFDTDAYTVQDVGPLPSQIVDLVAKVIPDGWIATAKVKAKL